MTTSRFFPGFVLIFFALVVMAGLPVVLSPITLLVWWVALGAFVVGAVSLAVNAYSSEVFK